MRYLALVADYDGTLASGDRVSEETNACDGAPEGVRAPCARAPAGTDRHCDRDRAFAAADVAAFARVAGKTLAWPEGLSYQPGRVIAWFAGTEDPPFAMEPQRGRAERIRHLRKYAEGDLRWHSFYFRGPDGRHNLT
jgi:hypothetical protein